MKQLSQSILLTVLSYDSENGEFYRLPSMKRSGWTDSRGHRRIMIKGQNYAAHRLAWLYMTGKWPTEQIDHRNNVRDDNRWSNLREATNAQNQMNRAREMKGASFHRQSGLWHSRIKVEGKEVSLGYFQLREQAHSAYVRAAVKYFGEFARP